MARPFHFTLQRVLDYRTQLEEQARLVLARAQREYDLKAQEVIALRALITEHKAKLASERQQDVNELWLHRAYAQRLNADLSRAEAELLILAKELNKCRREAVLRSRDKKLLEKLKSNQARRHDQDEQLKEQSEFDEMATLRFRHPAQ